MMPYFDEAGRPYLEKLDAAKTAVRLVSGTPEIGDILDLLVRRARQIAAARATHDAGEIPDDDWQKLWDAEHALVTAARKEIGLPEHGALRPAMIFLQRKNHKARYDRACTAPEDHPERGISNSPSR